MYELLLAASLTGFTPAHDCPALCLSAPRICCPPSKGGGIVLFFFTNNSANALTEAEKRLWQQYIAALESDERAGAVELWQISDLDGRRKLLGQVAGMRPTPKD